MQADGATEEGAQTNPALAGEFSRRVGPERADAKRMREWANLPLSPTHGTRGITAWRHRKSLPVVLAEECGYLRLAVLALGHAEHQSLKLFFTYIQFYFIQ